MDNNGEKKRAKQEDRECELECHICKFVYFDAIKTQLIKLVISDKKNK